MAQTMCSRRRFRHVKSGKKFWFLVQNDTGKRSETTVAALASEIAAALAVEAPVKLVIDGFELLPNTNAALVIAPDDIVELVEDVPEIGVREPAQSPKVAKRRRIGKVQPQHFRFGADKHETVSSAEGDSDSVQWPIPDSEMHPATEVVVTRVILSPDPPAAEATEAAEADDNIPVEEPVARRRGKRGKRGRAQADAEPTPAAVETAKAPEELEISTEEPSGKWDELDGRVLPQVGWRIRIRTTALDEMYNIVTVIRQGRVEHVDPAAKTLQLRLAETSENLNRVRFEWPSRTVTVGKFELTVSDYDAALERVLAEIEAIVGDCDENEPLPEEFQREADSLAALRLLAAPGGPGQLFDVDWASGQVLEAWRLV